MCGLCGIVGDLDHRDEEAVKRMMILNYFRGVHSTGFAGIRENNTVNIAKQLGGPWDLWEYPKFREACSGSWSKAFLAHARHATRGNVTTHNAHPFKFGHIVGAHNGTLDYTCVDSLKKELGEEFPVDSMYIFAAIEEFGIKEAISKLQGSWAISYVNLEDNTFNLIRNKERPLWYGTAEDGKAVFYASEWPMIAAGLAKEGHNAEYRKLWRDKEGTRFFGLQPDFHFSWKLDELKKGSAKPTVTKMEGKESFLEGFQNVSNLTGGNKSNPFKRGNQSCSVPATKTNRSTMTYPGGSETPTSLDVEGNEAVPYPGITKKEFADWTREGCQFCNKPIRYGETGITIYERQQMVLCREHSGRVPGEKVRIYVKNILKAA